MKLTSGFALLDVHNGREELHAHFQDRPRFGPCPRELRVPVLIHGYIGRSIGDDDGVSRPFEVIVTKVEDGADILRL